MKYLDILDNLLLHFQGTRPASLKKMLKRKDSKESRENMPSESDNDDLKYCEYSDSFSGSISYMI